MAIAVLIRMFFFFMLILSLVYDEVVEIPFQKALYGFP